MNSTSTPYIYSLSLHDALPIYFDHWFSEQSLYDSGKIIEALEKLSSAGYTYESEGATWLRSTDFGDEDRKSTRLNSSHVAISYAVFCLKKKKNLTSLVL